MHTMEDNTGAFETLLKLIQADERSSSYIARLAGVSQPTVSRLRNAKGNRVRQSASFNKLCIFYGIQLSVGTLGVDSYNEILRDAIIDAWDGTQPHGRALLAVIHGLKDLRNAT
jgi:transcriptional regulator with XRE-family HTH domain